MKAAEKVNRGSKTASRREVYVLERLQSLGHHKIRVLPYICNTCKLCWVYCVGFVGYITQGVQLCARLQLTA
jgi:Pyruvate/2-oxoacid:ferredoxin oxidoreductase delta subunit